MLTQGMLRNSLPADCQDFETDMVMETYLLYTFRKLTDVELCILNGGIDNTPFAFDEAMKCDDGKVRHCYLAARIEQPCEEIADDRDFTPPYEP